MCNILRSKMVDFGAAILSRWAQCLGMAVTKGSARLRALKSLKTEPQPNFEMWYCVKIKMMDEVLRKNIASLRNVSLRVLLHAL